MQWEYSSLLLDYLMMTDSIKTYKNEYTEFLIKERRLARQLNNGCIFLGCLIGNCIKGDFIPVLILTPFVILMFTLAYMTYKYGK